MSCHPVDMVGLSLSGPLFSPVPVAPRIPTKVSAARRPSMHSVSEVPLRQASHFGPTPVGKVPTTVGARVAAFLRGRYPVKTASCASAETGIHAATIEKMLERESAPSAHAFLLMAQAFGPAFMLDCYIQPPQWLSDAAHAARIRDAETRLEQAQAEIDRLKAVLA